MAWIDPKLKQAVLVVVSERHTATARADNVMRAWGRLLAKVLVGDAPDINFSPVQDQWFRSGGSNVLVSAHISPAASAEEAIKELRAEAAAKTHEIIASSTRRPLPPPPA